MGYETRLTDRERGIWRAALTLANNICVQESDLHNADDETSEADTANECAARVRAFIDADDKTLAELLAEAGVPDDGSDPLCEALNSGDGSYRP